MSKDLKRNFATEDIWKTNKHTFGVLSYRENALYHQRVLRALVCHQNRPAEDEDISFHPGPLPTKTKNSALKSW